VPIIRWQAALALGACGGLRRILMPTACIVHQPSGVRGDAGQVSAAGAVLDDDQGVDATQQPSVHMHEAGCEERRRVTIIVFARCLLVCPGTERHCLTSAGTETVIAARNSALRGKESIDLISEQWTLNPRARRRRSTRCSHNSPGGGANA
jgi:hypothetical protein